MTTPDRQFAAYQAFVLALKRDWTGRGFRTVRDSYRAVAAGQPARSAEDVAALLQDDTSARTFAFLERHLQRLKYSGRWGLHTHYDRQRDAVVEDLAAVPAGDLLALDEALALPEYYAAIDVHQHPGGLWSDAIAGVVYEHGARSTTPLLSQDKDLHRRFTDHVLALGPWRRLLDMGCGFGKSTAPFADAVPDGEVVGVDLAAPCLTLAARDAAAGQRRNLRYMQRDASGTGLPDGNFDVVTSTMLLHEMPPPVIRDLIAETHRLLAPGGLAIHLDFLPAQDPFAEWIHYGHGRRNNEPYMEPLAKMDVLGAMRAAGFVNVRALPFEEAPGALALADTQWRFPWTIIAGEKPAA